MAKQTQTNVIRKNMHGHWEARSEYELPGENRRLQVVTTKRFNGHTTTTYSAGTIGEHFFTHAPFSGDIYLTDDHGKVRLTEKLVEDLHEASTKEETIDEVIQQAEKFLRKSLGLEGDQFSAAVQAIKGL